MALAVKDGNQADTFLSSVVTGGEHIVAHSVVSLGATAISNIASAISGSVVSISNLPTTQAVTFGTATITGSASILNFPSSQTIAGTVTANLSAQTIGSGQTNLYGGIRAAIFDELLETGQIASQFNTYLNLNNPVPVSGAITANISGTVPASISSVPTHGVTIANSSVTVNGTFYQATQPVSLASLPSLAAGTAQIGSVTANISGTPSITFGNISGTITANVPNLVGQSATKIPVEAYDAASSAYVVPVAPYNANGAIQGGNPLSTEISWTDGNNVYSAVSASGSLAYVNTKIVAGSVTISSLPRVTLIDGSGSVVTANSAIEVFSATTTRSYLLVQVTTGSAYVNVGATATTANGIYLASGQGYAWETTIPQGICSLISSVTGTAYCAKQA